MNRAGLFVQLLLLHNHIDMVYNQLTTNDLQEESNVRTNATFTTQPSYTRAESLTTLYSKFNTTGRQLEDYITSNTPTNDVIVEHPAFQHATPPDSCILGPNADSLSQDQFSSQLTHGCRYDRLTKPITDGPLNVTLQVDIRHIEAMEQLQFKMHMLLQYRYLDKRLDYFKTSPSRGDMIGEDKLRDKIWIPHIVLSNERDTAIMGLGGKDVFVSISPHGEVVYSYRMTAKIYCWMDLKKFPFDEQVCDMHFQSWTYNESHLLLHWEDEFPVLVATQLHLTEFKLINYWTSTTTIPAPFSRGAFVGNYSNLVFKFKISREIGFYIMDYFIPSIMLVCTSWVTFWLQADNAAPRIALGTSTMLSFITLASGQSKNLPKVSYIKASEIWFLGCTIFIFASIAEFAFVNIIWRRKRIVEMEKASSKHILMHSLTPRLARRGLQKSSSMNNLHKSHSCSSLDGVDNKQPRVHDNGRAYNNYLTVHSFHSCNVPTITMQSEDDLIPNSRKNSFTSVAMPAPADANKEVHQKWATMTPQEIAIWIDKRSRFIFPLMFLVFNILYWSFVYAL